MHKFQSTQLNGSRYLLHLSVELSAIWFEVKRNVVRASFVTEERWYYLSKEKSRQKSLSREVSVAKSSISQQSVKLRKIVKQFCKLFLGKIPGD